MEVKRFRLASVETGPWTHPPATWNVAPKCVTKLNLVTRGKMHCAHAPITPHFINSVSFGVIASAQI